MAVVPPFLLVVDAELPVEADVVDGLLLLDVLETPVVELLDVVEGLILSAVVLVCCGDSVVEGLFSLEVVVPDCETSVVVEGLLLFEVVAVASLVVVICCGDPVVTALLSPDVLVIAVTDTTPVVEETTVSAPAVVGIV